MIVKSQIISLLNDALNQTARLRKGGDQLVYFCKCGHYKRKLEVLLEDGPGFGIWHCWVCGKSGNLGKLLSLFECQRSYRDKLYALTKDIRIVRSRKSKTLPTDVVLPEEFHPLAKPKTTPEYKNALAYVKRRGILPEDIVRYNIGYCEKGDYAYHVIVPSYDAKGNLNFYMGRRYYESEGVIPHKKPQVSMDVVGFELFINYNEPLNLCEGIFDAISIRNNAIPLFGKYPSKQLREKMIINGVKRVNIVLDSDAMDDSVKNYTRLIKDVPNIEVGIVKMNGKDPSSMGFEKIHTLIRNTPPFDFNDLLDYELGL